MVGRKLELSTRKYKEYFLIFLFCFGRCTGQMELMVQEGIAHLCNISEGQD